MLYKNLDEKNTLFRVFIILAVRELIFGGKSGFIALFLFDEHFHAHVCGNTHVWFWLFPCKIMKLYCLSSSGSIVD